MQPGGRLDIGIIGAGRVGPVLGVALAGAGHRVVAITSGSDNDRVEALLPGVRVCAADEVARVSQLVLVTVPHDQLPDLVHGLADLGAWQPGQLVCHSDPAYGTVVLSPAQQAGAIPLAIHPAIMFSGSSIDVSQLSGCFAAVTASAMVVPIAQALAVEIGCEPVMIAEDDRPRYAEAIATVTAFSGEIIRQSMEILARVGVENPGSYLSGLVRSCVDEALRQDV